MTSNIRSVGSWGAILLLICFGGNFASWGFYSATLGRRLELARVELSATIARDEDENRRRHDALLADRAATRAAIEATAAEIVALKREVSALRRQVITLKGEP